MKKTIISLLLIATLLIAQTQTSLDQFKGTVYKVGPLMQAVSDLRSGEIKDVFPNLGVISYRAIPPTSPGSCKQHGSGVWATDQNYLYVCVQNQAQDDFTWARVPVQKNW